MTTRMGPGVGRVLQGYFCSEQFQGAESRGSRATVVPSMSSGQRVTVPAPPRPDLLPAKMLGAAAQPRLGPSPPGVPRRDLLPAKIRGMVGQPRSERPPGAAWSGAPRPDLLPGMGPARMGGPGTVRTVAQARPADVVVTTPISAGALRVIGEGRPLDPAVRQTMEAFFQADFSGVRVHEGATARSIGALAFTLGDEIHFAPGLYDPGSREGMALLGHELPHVVQQRNGRVANPYGQGVAVVQDPALEAEAERMGQRVAEELWSGTRAGQAKQMGARPGRAAVMPNVVMRAEDKKEIKTLAPAESDDMSENPGFWYTGERQAPPPSTRGADRYTSALETGQKRFLTLSAGPQDTINPGVSQSTWTRYQNWYRSTFHDDGRTAMVVTYFHGCDAKGDAKYENYFDTETGTITASHNVRSPQEKASPAHALGGSEILFRQIILVEDTTGRPFILRTLVRKSVVNPVAQALITYLRIKYGAFDIKHRNIAFDIAYGSSDFLALLGTENGTAATYLVYDHGFYLGVRGISKARITEKGSIEFHFTPGPRGR